MIVLGYDPGGGKKSGKGQSGVACLRVEGAEISFLTAQCPSVEDALEWFVDRCAGATPYAIGIDTFLHWGTKKKGWRPADLVLREAWAKCPRVVRSVQPTNSTQGSMAVQGMALAIVARCNWPSIILNEVHPKVLFAECAKDRAYPRGASEADAAVRIEFLRSEGYECQGDMKCDDEFDAALCCFATIKGLQKRWSDLLQLSPPDWDPIFPAGKAIYLWPRSLEADFHRLVSRGEFESW
jgi:hypothetical protein